MVNDRQIYDFLKNGGKITHCPTIRNNVDRKKINRKREPRGEEIKLNSEICKLCPKKCKDEMCYPLTWINGNEPSQEILLSDVKNSQFLTKDYKEVINELAENEQHQIELEDIFAIDNIRQRGIAILIHIGHFTKSEVAGFMRITPQHLRRIAK